MPKRRPALPTVVLFGCLLVREWPPAYAECPPACPDAAFLPE
eukprot:COSAG01_NODE_1045_length_11952_cov_98.448241_1_plen_41_part_10